MKHHCVGAVEEKPRKDRGHRSGKEGGPRTQGPKKKNLDSKKRGGRKYRYTGPAGGREKEERASREALKD